MAGQTAGHVVPDEGLDDGLSEKRTLHYIYQQFMNLDLVWQIKWGPCSDRVIARPNQAVDLIVVRRLGVGVSVLSQRLAGIPVASQTFLIQMNVHGGVQLKQRERRQSSAMFFGLKHFYETILFKKKKDNKDTFFNRSLVCLK